jgi:hypothetical protein
MLPDNTGLPAPVPGDAPAQEQIPGTTGNEPKFVTAEEAQRMAQEAGEKAFRRAQSLVDQSTTRLANTINERVEAIKQGMTIAGQTLTPEQEAQLRQKVAIDAMSTIPQPQDPASQPPQAGAEPTNWVDATAGRFAAEVGGIADTDPEVGMVKVNAATPDEYLFSVQQAVAAKKARIASTQQLPPQHPAAGIPAAGLLPSGGNPINDKSPRDLISEGLRG